jgi:hypothetical protein
MKTFILATLLAVTAASGVVVAAQSAAAGPYCDPTKGYICRNSH